MNKIEQLVRPNILNLKPYSSARNEFKGSKGIFLDANENPFGRWNRYPDPLQNKLKEVIAESKGLKSSNVFIGNGSDEVIDLAYRIFCQPGKDKAISFTPSYGMYEVSANINDVTLIQLALTNNFQIDFNTISPHLNDTSIKLMFICSPNNPTGNVLNLETTKAILDSFNGIVIIDEAYIDFAKDDSLISLIENYEKLIICQTMSKAWGLASARIGIAYANENIIHLFNKIKAPYNVSRPNQEAALMALQNRNTYKENINLILKERNRIRKVLENLKLIKKVYPSDANFLLVKVGDADKLYNYLINEKIIIRNRNKQIKNCLRLSIGTMEQNNQLIKALKSYA